MRDPCDLVRDVFGNPFWGVPILAESAAGLENVRKLAESIYDDGRFEEVPILADALMDAGCHKQILSHCREPGNHVRGCWVVDLLLGKG